MANKSARDTRAERAAVALQEQQRRERRRATLMIGGVVLAMLVIVAGGFLINRARDTSANVSAAPAGSGSYGVTIGSKSAPNSVVIYEDFLCPYCGELEKATHSQLATLADQAKVYVEYRPFNLLQTDYSVAAASAFKVVLDTSGPAVAKKFHDELYADQPSEGGPFPGSSWLVDKAVAAGASRSAVASGIEKTSEKAWVAQASAKAQAAGVRSTPTVLVDGKVYTDWTTIGDLTNGLI